MAVCDLWGLLGLLQKFSCPACVFFLGGGGEDTTDLRACSNIFKAMHMISDHIQHSNPFSV